MRQETVFFFLGLVIFFQGLLILYQQVMLRRDLPKKIKEISQKLSEILEKDSDEKLMVFTDHQVLIDLAEQINRLLSDRQKIKVDYRKQEISIRKMLSNVSHDIKTPLTVILGYLEIMRLHGAAGQVDQETAGVITEETIGKADRKMLGKVEEKAEQVMELINQFFTLAKLEAGDRKLRLTEINLCEVCRESILSFYEIFLEQDFLVEVEIPEAPILVKGEKDAIQRILFNLISNVLRYGKDGKYIGVFLREEEKEVWIDVVDRGKGVEKQFAKSIFERLYTMEDSRNREVQGSGLGLTIASHLAQELGGDIFLDSEPGVRTVFTVHLKKSGKKIASR